MKTMKGAKKKKARSREKSRWQKEILESGYECRPCSEIHWKVFVYGVKFDVWPTTGKWLEEGYKSKKGLESFRERVDVLGEEQAAMNDLDRRFTELTK